MAGVYKQLQAQAEESTTRARLAEEKYEALSISHDKRGNVLAELQAANDSLLTMNKMLTEEIDLLRQKDKTLQQEKKDTDAAVPFIVPVPSATDEQGLTPNEKNASASNSATPIDQAS